MQDPQSLHKYLYVHGDPVQGVDPTGLAIEPYDPDPSPLTASLKGILAHRVFTEYVLRNHGIANAGATLATVLPQYFPAGSPGSDLKPDAVDTKVPTFFELKPISHIRSAGLQNLDYTTQLQYYDTHLPPVGYDRGLSSRIVPFVSGGAFIGEFTYGDDAYSVFAYPEQRAILEQSGRPDEGLIYYTLKEMDGNKKRDRPRPPVFFFDRVITDTGEKIRTVRREFIDVASQLEGYHIAAYTALSLTAIVGFSFGAQLGAHFGLVSTVSVMAKV